jgi:trimeric autotransporter adhesin
MKRILLFIITLGISIMSQAQLSGTHSIPGSYPTIAAAIADLNLYGVGTGGVTFYVSVGYSETFASRTGGFK